MIIRLHVECSNEIRGESFAEPTGGGGVVGGSGGGAVVVGLEFPEFPDP
ncbi:MAG: hypothetical protein VCC36_13360 [Gammaproteobacteria bacterium]